MLLVMMAVLKLRVLIFLFVDSSVAPRIGAYQDKTKMCM